MKNVEPIFHYHVRQELYENNKNVFHFFVLTNSKTVKPNSPIHNKVIYFTTFQLL